MCIHISKFNMSSKRRQKGRSKDFYHISILWFGPDFIDEPWPEQSETWHWWMWAWSKHSFVSMTEKACLLPACVSVRMSTKTFKKACLFRLNLTLADANASLSNFLCQFPAHESTCKMLLLKSYFTPRVLLKITFTPISSCVFLVPRHFYPLKHIRMCILSNNGTQAIQLFPSLLLSTER